jgi:hypothetical protein
MVASTQERCLAGRELFPPALQLGRDKVVRALTCSLVTPRQRSEWEAFTPGTGEGMIRHRAEDRKSACLSPFGVQDRSIRSQGDVSTRTALSGRHKGGAGSLLQGNARQGTLTTYGSHLWYGG